MGDYGSFFEKRKPAQLHRILSLTTEQIKSKNAAHKERSLVSTGRKF